VDDIIRAIDLVTRFHTYEGVVEALNGMTLTIGHGITFGLVGESGCGKSVFVRSLMRIVQAPGRIEGGRVIFYPGTSETGGVDLLGQPESYMEKLRGDRISMIFQEPGAALNPIMRIGDQVAESFLFHRQQEMYETILTTLGHEYSKWTGWFRNIQRKIYRLAARDPGAPMLAVFNRIPLLRRWKRPMAREALRRSVELLGKLGIPQPGEMVKRYPHNLSGGMKQRVVIAMALACGPMLLIADEATSSLDVTIQAQILDLLRRLKETEISTVLLITHDLGVVAETCDRVGVMYAGNLCELAGTRDLFTAPRHPYSRALLDAVPKLTQSGPLQTIEGSVPNLLTPPSGSAFRWYFRIRPPPSTPGCWSGTSSGSPSGPPVEPADGRWRNGGRRSLPPGGAPFRVFWQRAPCRLPSKKGHRPTHADLYRLI